jgi:DNA-binding NarL/FixJ family response regulator
MSNVIASEFGPFIEVVVSAKSDKVARDYTPTETSVALITKYGNKSNAIRALLAEGHKTSVVADMLNIRYQHVNNVKNQIVKKVVTAA